jgi:hypothetical protein
MELPALSLALIFATGRMPKEVASSASIRQLLPARATLRQLEVLASLELVRGRVRRSAAGAAR